MSEPVRVESLRGIMVRGPGVSATLPFHEDMWSLSLSPGGGAAGNEV